MDFEWSLFVISLPSLARGAEITALLAVVSLAFGLVIGIAGALLHATGIRPLVWAVTFWTTLIRGLPLLVTLLFLYYGLPSLGILLSSVTVAITAMSITAGAYVTEIVRAGIESIDRGQMRAAKSLGMSWMLAMRKVVLPQALRRVLPPLTNEAITLLKNTALVSVIAIPDLLRAGTDIMTWKANTFSPFAGVALFYLCMTLPLVALNARLEKRFQGELEAVEILFRDATVLSGGDDWSAKPSVDVLVANGYIAGIGVGLAAPADALIVSASSLVLTPAFANAHTHSPEMLGRGVLPMAEQTEWLSHAYADGRDALSDADITRAVRLCAADAVRGGAVRVTDHFRQVPTRARAVRVAAQAWAATGLEARIAPVLRDRVAPGGGLVGVPNSSGSVATTKEVLSLAEELLEDAWPVPVGLGPSAPQRVTDELLVGLAALMHRRGSFLHMHLCESAADAANCRALYGVSAVAHLDRIGVLGPGVEFAHVVHVDDDDLSLMAARGVRMAHNPVANLRLGSGVAPVARALARGVDVALGTDGAGSNDSQSLLEAAKFALLAPRAAWPASEWLSPEQVLGMATNRARLVPGAPGDLIAFDAEASAFVGAGRDWATRIVLAAQATDIVHVLGRGAFLMRDRTVRLP